MVVDLFDIDGTLTIPGNDLWLLVTRALASDTVAFDAVVSEWEVDMSSGAEAQDRTRQMLRTGVALLANGVDGDAIRRTTREIVATLIERGCVHLDAMDFLAARVSQGVTPVLVTANYVEGGQGFVESLRTAGLIDANVARVCRVTGSVIDWQCRTIQHFNFGQGKVIGAATALGIDPTTLSKRVHFAFGDDPDTNDSAMLSLAQQPLVVSGERNRESTMTPPTRHFCWSQWRGLAATAVLSADAGIVT